MSFPVVAAAAWLCAFALASPVFSQSHEPLPDKDAFELYTRAFDLMESTSVAVPELARAGGPIIENVRHAAATMRALGRQHVGVTYSLLSNVRAYLELADAIPKPGPLAEEVARQFAELRELLDRARANFRLLLDSRESVLRGPDPNKLTYYAEANSKLPAPEAGRPRVVFLGDSITELWRLNEYFTDRDIVNRGICGQTSSEILGRMKADVIDLKPTVVLVLAGTNDIARGVPLQTIEGNLTMIADLAGAHGIRPLFASLLPVSDYHQRDNPAWERTRDRSPQTIRALNEWIQAFCRERGYTYVDYFSATVDNKGYLGADLADDGLHPNSAGYRLMAPVALTAIEKVTAVAAEKPKKRHFPKL
jgi:lysophospholipase L1-like esterase